MSGSQTCVPSPSSLGEHLRHVRREEWYSRGLDSRCCDDHRGLDWCGRHSRRGAEWSNPCADPPYADSDHHCDGHCNFDGDGEPLIANSCTFTGALYLSDLPAISDLETGSRSLGGIIFAHALYNPLSGSERGPGEWVVPANVTAFTAQVGVEIDAAEADSRVTFVVTAGGSEVYKKTFAVGDSEPVRVPLMPNTRMKLESIIDRSRRGNCNAEAVAVWGDPAFR